VATPTTIVVPLDGFFTIEDDKIRRLVIFFGHELP
jgi:hypothetical protein